MNPPSLKEVQHFQRHIKTQHLRIYRSVLNAVLDHSGDFPLAKECRHALRHGDYLKLIEVADSMSTQCYVDATQHFVGNQIASLIRKFPFPSVPGIDPERRALEKFLASERSCKRINQRLRARRTREGKAWPFEGEFERARRFIRHVLGDSPDLREIYSRCNFSGGASVGVHGNATNVARKILSDAWSVTPGAFAYAFCAIRDNAHYRSLLSDDEAGFRNGCEIDEFRRYREHCTIVKHNKIAFVPKTALVHRTIAVEPLLNGYLQKGVDLYMRDLLRVRGIDLTDQDYNQRAASVGSLQWTAEDPLVTIDLQSASDSVSKELCRELLPPDWFDFLNQIRSTHYRIGSQEDCRYEKFCSMGNGFCFPLESLIFASFVASVEPHAPRRYAVYGDDIIVRRSTAFALLPVLKYAGFKVNEDKTFLYGPFRESCGGDYYAGRDVRPLVLDYRFDSLESLFKFYNLSQTKAKWFYFFAEAREAILKQIAPRFRFWRPFAGAPDSGLDSAGDEYLSSPYCRFRNGKWSWVELHHSPVKDTGVRRHCSIDKATMWAALTGSASNAPFVVRRQTKCAARSTLVRGYASAGAVSNWLPTPS